MIRRASGAVLIAVGLLGALPAQASRPGGAGLFDVRAARVPERGGLRVGLLGTGYRLHSAQDPEEGGRVATDGGLGVLFGVGRGVALFASVEGTAHEYRGTVPIVAEDAVIGAQAAWRAGLPRWLRAGAVIAASLPTGVRSRGLSTRSVTPEAALLLSVRLPDPGSRTVTRLHLNAGLRAFHNAPGRTLAGYPAWYLPPVHPRGDSVRLDLRAALESASPRMRVFVELVADRIADDRLAWKEGPLFLTPGAEVALGGGVSLLGGVKVALSRDDPTSTAYRPPRELFPDWQLLIGVSWSNGPRPAWPSPTPAPSPPASSGDSGSSPPPPPAE
ncbi:MAG: hypothetical protein QGH59_00625, partial [Gemmatimonadota bacterium]|nr:hypothetical protein [Gemmatimonadota bacterium]